jgi:hypothetical protein
VRAWAATRFNTGAQAPPQLARDDLGKLVAAARQQQLTS